MATRYYPYDISLRLDFVACLYAKDAREEYVARLINSFQALEIYG